MINPTYDECGCEIATEREDPKLFKLTSMHHMFCLLPYQDRESVEADKDHVLFHLDQIIKSSDFEEECLHKVLTESDFADGISDLMIERVASVELSPNTILFLMTLHLHGDKFNISPFVDRARKWNTDFSELPESWIIKYYAGEWLKREQWAY